MAVVFLPLVPCTPSVGKDWHTQQAGIKHDKEKKGLSIMTYTFYSFTVIRSPYQKIIAVKSINLSNFGR